MNIHRPGCHLKHVICTFSPFALLSLTHLDYLPNIIALLLNYFYLLYANTDCTSFVKVSVKNGTETAETESWKRRKRKSCVKLVYTCCIKFHLNFSKLFALIAFFFWYLQCLTATIHAWFVFYCFVSSSSNTHQVQCSKVLLTKRPECASLTTRPSKC